MLNYIPIPTNFHQSKKVLSMMAKEGAHGYGVFLLLLQLARDNEHRWITSDIELLAYAIRETDTELVGRIVKNYDLFETLPNDNVYSPVLDSLMSEYDAKKAAAREAGRRGAAARYSKANAEQPNGDPIATLEQPQSNKTIQDKTKGNFTQSRSKLLEEEFMGLAGADLVSFCRSEGKAIDAEFIEAVDKKATPGYTPQFLAETCAWFGVHQFIFAALLKWCNHAKCGDPRYTFLLKLQKDAEKAEFRPKYPAEYLVSKCIEFDKQH